MPTLVLMAVFGAVLVLVLALLQLVQGRRLARRQVLHRLAALSPGRDTALSETERLIHEVDLGSAGHPLQALRHSLSSLIRQSLPGLGMGWVALYGAALAAACLMLSVWLVPDTVGRLALTPALWLVAVGVLLQRRRGQRIATARAQLPAAIEIIIRSAESGHPLVAAFALVGREMPDPIGTEFRRLAEQLTFGAALEPAVQAMTERLGVEEMGLLAVTLTVQSQTGGRLSEVLRNLSTVIRERGMMQARVRAITAEGRGTAAIMVIFPFALFLTLRALMPGYFDPLWDSGYGGPLLVLLGGMMAVGLIMLNRMIQFEY